MAHQSLPRSWLSQWLWLKSVEWAEGSSESTQNKGHWDRGPMPPPCPEWYQLLGLRGTTRGKAWFLPQGVMPGGGDRQLTSPCQGDANRWLRGRESQAQLDSPERPSHKKERWDWLLGTSLAGQELSWICRYPTQILFSIWVPPWPYWLLTAHDYPSFRELLSAKGLGCCPGIYPL